jgi:glutaredoxin-like protein
MPPLLDSSITTQIRQVFQQLQHPVELVFFGSQEHCDYCAEIRQLLEELTPLSDKIRLSVHDLKEDAELAAHYRVDKAPAIVIAAREGEQVTDLGIRYLGIPSGHEFTTLIQDIILVSGRDSGLTKATREYLKSLEKPLHLQVFVTPT